MSVQQHDPPGQGRRDKRHHNHGHHHHAHAVDAGNERTLWLVLALTGGFMLVEAVTGWLTGSLALISDAAHMFTDSAAIADALAAMDAREALKVMVTFL